MRWIALALPLLPPGNGYQMKGRLGGLKARLEKAREEKRAAEEIVFLEGEILALEKKLEARP